MVKYCIYIIKQLTGFLRGLEEKSRESIGQGFCFSPKRISLRICFKSLFYLQKVSFYKRKTYMFQVIFSFESVLERLFEIKYLKIVCSLCSYISWNIMIWCVRIWATSFSQYIRYGLSKQIRIINKCEVLENISTNWKSEGIIFQICVRNLLHEIQLLTGTYI